MNFRCPPSFVERGTQVRRQHGDLVVLMAAFRKGSRLTVRLTNSGFTGRNTTSWNDRL